MPRPADAAPCGSKSTSSTFRPYSAKAAARFTHVVVLPTPPFWLAKATIRAGPVPLRAGGSGNSVTSLTLLWARRCTAAGTRVSGLVNLAQCVARDKRIDLGGRDRGVPQQLLHHADVGASAQQVRRKRVAQRVWRYVFDSGALGGGLDDGPAALPAPAPAASIEKQRRGSLSGRGQH